MAGKEAISSLQFDQGATRVIFNAVEEAAKFNHNYIGTEHLTLAAAQEPRVDTALKDHGSSGKRVVEAIRFITGKDDPNRFRLENLDLTPRAQYVVGLAAAYAKEHATNLDAPVVVTTQSLVAGVIQEGEGIGAGVLESVLDDRRPSFVQRVGEVPKEDPEIKLRETNSPLEAAFAYMVEGVFHATLQPGQLKDGKFVRSTEPVVVNGKELIFTYTRLDPTTENDPAFGLAFDLLSDAEIKEADDDKLKRALRQKMVERDGYFSQASALMDPSYYNRDVPVERWPEQIRFSIAAQKEGGLAGDSSNQRKPEIVGVLNIPVRLSDLEVFNSTPNREPSLSIRLPEYDDLITRASSASYRRRPLSEAGATISPVPYYKDPQKTADQLGRFISGLL